MGARIDVRVLKATHSKVLAIPIVRTLCVAFSMCCFINHMSVGSLIDRVAALIVWSPSNVTYDQQNPRFEQSNVYSEERGSRVHQMSTVDSVSFDPCIASVRSVFPMP